ncbi:hypothetical protein QVD17_17213 [Tagetes erecta]|uniref:Uncharacterized protein n=1 Tax=Tagetes erecta TaxID=13708 RepID=A0AAD8KZ23_TARER|nr:hypothetical protein QVD17_17213 [Tagetes erecta]
MGTFEKAQSCKYNPLRNAQPTLFIPHFANPFNAQSIMATGCIGKSSWPELVGATGEAAATKIEKENPRVDAIVLLDGTPTTRDLRCDRVWVWVNSNGVVIRTPIIQ